MELSPAYIKWREDTLQQGQRLMIEALLRTRLGELDEALLAIISPLLELPPDECMSLGLHASREELLAQFGSNSRED